MKVKIFDASSPSTNIPGEFAKFYAATAELKVPDKCEIFIILSSFFSFGFL